MKRVGFLFDKICNRENIVEAIKNASKNKLKKFAVRQVINNFDQSVDFIQDLLVNKKYKPSKYYQATIKDGLSKKERIIYKPKFYPDQIIHWCLINIIKPHLMRGMYYLSCASVPGRGMHHAKKYCERWIQNDIKNTKYCLKLDIRKFYPSIDLETLKSKFRRIIKDEDTLWLIDSIVDSHNEGLPIGNYTSQWFANFYLQDLDHYIKNDLRTVYYIRYMDDLVLMGSNKRQLKKQFEAVRLFLKREKLEVKSNWQIFNISKRKLDFCGFCFCREKTTIRKRITRNLRRSFFRISRKPGRRNAASIMSYYGWIYHTDSYVLYEKYFSKNMKIYKEMLKC